MSSSAGGLAAVLAAEGPPNPWFDADYVRDNASTIVLAVQEHVYLTWTAVLAGLLIAVPLALVARRYPRLEGPVLGFEGVLYTIPALALFAMLQPVLGLRALVVQIGLVTYTLLILSRNTLTGLKGVPPEVREAAVGMGFGPTRLFLRVELPLALPALVAGLRVATVSTISLVTVGGIFGYGGLGTLIFQGYNTNFFRAQIMTATVLCVALAVVAELLLYGAQRAVTPWQRGRAAA